MPNFPIERASDPNDPNRCQSSVSNGQCPNLAFRAPDGTFPGDKCVMHGGHAVAARYKAEIAKTYRLTSYNSRLQELKSHPDIKSLRDEIAIMRIMVEERLNRIKPDNEVSFLSATGPVSEMIAKIEKLVKTCHALEKETGITLDKNQVLAIGEQIITAVINNIEELNLEEEVVSNLLQNLMADIDKIFKGEVINRHATTTKNERADEPITVADATVADAEEPDIS